MAKVSALDKKLAEIDADIERLVTMRAYLVTPSADAPPKRERKKNVAKTAAEAKTGF